MARKNYTPEISAQLDDIVLFLAGRIGMAQATSDQRFIERFGGLIAALERINQGERVVRLDG